jgi:hypothetical protein
MNAASREAVILDAMAPGSAERLLDLQLAFNLYPSWYAHPSWLARLGIADTDAQLQQSPLWIRSVSSALLRSEQLHQHFDSDFFDPAKRLALIDAPSLTRVAELVGATLLRERLKRLVRHDEVRAARECIGAEAHAFAVRWGGLLPMITVPFERGPWPSKAEWQRASVLQIFAALPGHAIGAIGRMRMRFPYEWNLVRGRLGEPQRVGFTRLIVAVLMQSTPQWRWLFETSVTGDS